MQLNVPPDLETLINKRLSGGGYESVVDVLRRALEAQDAEESWTDEERRALSAHIEEGYQQAERGELIDGAQARREIQAMKDDWRLSKLVPIPFSPAALDTRAPSPHPKSNGSPFARKSGSPTERARPQNRARNG